MAALLAYKPFAVAVEQRGVTGRRVVEPAAALSNWPWWGGSRGPRLRDDKGYSAACRRQRLGAALRYAGPEQAHATLAQLMDRGRPSFGTTRRDFSSTASNCKAMAAMSAALSLPLTI